MDIINLIFFPMPIILWHINKIEKPELIGLFFITVDVSLKALAIF